MGKRVFVVDDEKLIADTLAIILRNSGHEASAFYAPESVLAACASSCPDLVISDVVMPEMSGIDMAVLIRERHPACKILLFSGQAATVNLLEEARKRGHNFELLSKPVHPKDLLAALNRVSPQPYDTPQDAAA
jgi:DNA-binding NtrC family response regulator